MLARLVVPFTNRSECHVVPCTAPRHPYVYSTYGVGHTHAASSTVFDSNTSAGDTVRPSRRTRPTHAGNTNVPRGVVVVVGGGRWGFLTSPTLRSRARLPGSSGALPRGGGVNVHGKPEDRVLKLSSPAPVRYPIIHVQDDGQPDHRSQHPRDVLQNHLLKGGRKFPCNRDRLKRGDEERAQT